jgi:hypothetical protein
MLLLLLLDGMEVGVNSREGEELRRRRRRSSIESREWKRERERERERERDRETERQFRRWLLVPLLYLKYRNKKWLGMHG